MYHQGQCGAPVTRALPRLARVPRALSSASPERKEEPAPPPKLGALDSVVGRLSKGEVEEWSGSRCWSRGLCRRSTVAQEEKKELRPRGGVEGRFVQDATGGRESPRRGDTPRKFLGDRARGKSFNLAASLARQYASRTPSASEETSHWSNRWKQVKCVPNLHRRSSPRRLSEMMFRMIRFTSRRLIWRIVPPSALSNCTGGRRPRLAN